MLRLILLLLASAILPGLRADGLIARFEQGGKIDAIALPNAAFFVPSGQAATRFLSPGDLMAELSGFVSIDLRAQYAFQMEISGHAELFVNGRSILQYSGFGLSELSKPVRLNKGTNALAVKFTAGGKKDAAFRLFWKSRDMALALSIPSGALSHDENDLRLVSQQILRTGADAYLKYRCDKCHSGESSELDSPDLHQAGARLGRDWMARWIADPGQFRANPHMPRLVSPADAGAIADYLGAVDVAKPAPASGDTAAGEKLYTTLQCAKCHGEEQGTVRLNGVAAKYQPGALQAFLQDPQAHYRWNPMPNFKLTGAEAANLAAFLGEPKSRSTSTGSAERGRELFETSGCLRCHAGPGENRFTVKPIASPDKGCLSEESSDTPRFSFDEATRDALVAFLRNGSGNPVSPMEFALRETAALRCAECHNASDGVIRLEALGRKLRPEWVEKILRGDLASKPRSWLPARMPAFPAYAEGLAEGLAALHGVPPRTAEEPPIDKGLAETGAKLISAAGGFSCVACHAVGANSEALVVESPGINLALSGERLLPSFFQRWIMNPLALDPATKMPVYFDESGRSQLIEVFEGDGAKQIEAMWHYVRLGQEMPAPPTP